MGLNNTQVQVLHGDCLEVLKTLEPDSISSVITDPPYGLGTVKDLPGLMQAWMSDESDREYIGKTGFMNREWDAGVPGPRYWKEVYRVMKPGAHLLCFSGTRTWDLMSMALRFAGFENRDTISNEGPPALRWIYGQGFPKAANAEKLIAKCQGQKRRAHGMVPLEGPQSARMHSGIYGALKPAWEVILVFRKPLEGSISSNILKHGEWLEDGTVYKVGTGGLQIDASRVGNGGNHGGGAKMSSSGKTLNNFGEYESDGFKTSPTGRFPANLLLSHVPGPNGCVRVGSRRVPNGRWGKAKPSERHQETNGYEGGWGDGVRVDPADPDGLEEVPEFICAKDGNGDYICPVALLDEQTSHLHGAGNKRPNVVGKGMFGMGERVQGGHNFGDSGGASRFFSQFHDPNPGFFYAPKASRAERNRGLEGMPEKSPYEHDSRKALNIEHRLDGSKREVSRHTNHHPTVKPVKLLSYLVRLVTPENGTCLDPFAGSGSTGVAALSEGFNAILIEAEPEYCEIAERRCAHALNERAEPEKGEVRTAKEWGLENVHPQDAPLRYNPDERPEEGGTFEPVEEPWEDKRTGPEPDDLTYGEVIEKFAAALAKTEEQFKDRLF